MKTTTSRSLAVATLLGVVLALSGCRDALSSVFSKCDQCGTIESITPRRVQGDTSGGGAVAGAVGGAVAGNEVEKRRNQYLVYDVTLRMEKKGDVRHITVASRENLNPGDRVEVSDGRLVRSDRSE